MNLEDAQDEIVRWRKIAAYLAECHAATLEGAPARTSKLERRRLAAICEKAARYLEGEDMPPLHYRMRDSGIPSAVARCREAILRYGPDARTSSTSQP